MNKNTFKQTGKLHGKGNNPSHSLDASFDEILTAESQNSQYVERIAMMTTENLWDVREVDRQITT